jgi:hypothetical protein
LLGPEDGVNMLLPVPFTRLHGVISQKIELLITVAVRTSNQLWLSEHLPEDRGFFQSRQSIKEANLF